MIGLTVVIVDNITLDNGDNQGIILLAKEKKNHEFIFPINTDKAVLGERVYFDDSEIIDKEDLPDDLPEDK